MTQAHPSKRRTRPAAALAWAVLGLLGALPLGAGAACTEGNPKFVRDYEGTLDFNQTGMLVGSLGNRHGAPGGDESIHRAASDFREAVAKGDRKAVASLVRYPITVRVASGKLELRNDRALVANYAAIFTPKFRDLIASRVPRQFMRSSEGIMYGRGEVYFDELGKVFALNAP